MTKVRKSGGGAHLWCIRGSLRRSGCGWAWVRSTATAASRAAPAALPRPFSYASPSARNRGRALHLATKERADTRQLADGGATEAAARRLLPPTDAAPPRIPRAHLTLPIFSGIARDGSRGHLRGFWMTNRNKPSYGDVYDYILLTDFLSFRLNSISA